MSKKIAVTLNDRAYIGVDVEFRPYMDPAGGMAVILKQGHEQLAVATVNLAPQGYSPGPGCAFINDYTENSGVLDSLVNAGVVEETGLVIHSGFGHFPEVRFIGEWADAFREADREGRRRRIEMLREMGQERDC